jgi:hypothetical protein
MNVIKATVSQGNHQNHQNHRNVASKPQPKSGNGAPHPPLSAIHPYIRSMREILLKRHEEQVAGKQKKKATGVTRRLMEEVHVAKENMHLYNRLIAVAPSTDLERRNLLKDFSKSREYLGKMSRYCYAESSAGQRPAWDDYWPGCMV